MRPHTSLKTGVGFARRRNPGSEGHVTYTFYDAPGVGIIAMQFGTLLRDEAR